MSHKVTIEDAIRTVADLAQCNDPERAELGKKCFNLLYHLYKENFPGSKKVPGLSSWGEDHGRHKDYKGWK